MIEVPAAAFLIDRLSGYVDFFSIGTNDLLQYFTAVDRASAKVGPLYTPAQPAFLRLLRKIVVDARTAGRWVGMCGEMAGQLRYLPLLVGLGLDEISLAPPLIGAAKAALSAISTAASRDLLAQALDASGAAEVEALLGRPVSACPIPLTTPDLVSLDGEARTKAEAIKEAVDRLFVAGRTDRPRDIEEAVWPLEAACSTGFGHGFAIPHCRTDAVRASSLVVLRLDEPIEWGSLDGQPVRVLVLLVTRESDQATEHLRILAALARHLMHVGFRERLEHETEPGSVCEFLCGAVTV
jgi:fructose-specific PTS system IIA-like component